MVSYKREKKLKELRSFLRDLFLITSFIMLIMKCTRMFHTRNDLIHARTLWLQKVVSNVSLQKEFTKLNNLTHVFPKMQFILHFV